jgi:hypothetical protein
MLETRCGLASELNRIGESEEALKVDEGSQKLAELMVSVTTLNHPFPDQKDLMAIVADGEEWVVIRSSEMKEWREKLTQRAEEREELLRTKKAEKTRRGEPSFYFILYPLYYTTYNTVHAASRLWRYGAMAL